MMENIIDDWDSAIRSKYNLHDVKDAPVKSCDCVGTDILPFDYYTESDGNIVICSICRYCGGYNETSDERNIFPIPFKPVPSIAGLMCNTKDVKKGNMSLYS